MMKGLNNDNNNKNFVFQMAFQTRPIAIRYLQQKSFYRSQLFLTTINLMLTKSTIE